MALPGRSYYAGNSSYRYGFNGQEKSDEIGDGFTTAKFWEYDSRIGKRWNVDPVEKADESPYLTFGGNPIKNNDVNGDDWWDITKGVAQGAWNDVQGIAQAVRHPINTSKALIHAAAHPINTFNTIKSEIKKDWNSGDQGKGRAIWAVGSLFIPGEGEAAATEKTVLAAEKSTVILEKAAVKEAAKGGTYTLRESGIVKRTGRTNNLARRKLEHEASEETGHLTFVEEHRTDNYAAQRGLEHTLYELHKGTAATSKGGLNKIRAMSEKTLKSEKGKGYIKAAENYLKKQK